MKTTPQRSYIMSRIKSKNTKCERLLGMALVREGFRHKKWGDIFGKPDFVFEHSRTVVFVDGCFFHRCPRHLSTPKVNSAFWATKFARNIVRDIEVNDRLRTEGWTCLRFWECDVKRDLNACIQKIKRFVSQG